MKKMLLNGFLILATILQVGYVASALAVDGPGSSEPQRISGTVDRVENNSIYIRTDDGALLSYPINRGSRDDYRAFNEGERVVVERTWMNRMVTVYPATILISSQALGYRTISGKVQSFSPSDERLTVQTRSGETETFTVTGPAARKMNRFKEGSHVTVQVDDQDRVIDVRRG